LNRPLASTLALTWILLAAASSTRAASPDDLAEAYAAVQRAVDRGDAAAAVAARAPFEVAAAADPRSATARVGLAYADWRATTLLFTRDRAQARRIAEDGLRRIDEALRLEPRSAAALALKGGLQGLLIGLDPGRMMMLGPDSDANLRRARALGAADPRVWLLDGIGALNKPALFGGGAEAALESLRRAQELFAADTAAARDPRAWGHDDAWAWTGRAELARRDPVAAIEAYRRALTVNPSNGWVAKVLLPEAEKAHAEQAKR
jgi:tetratricopeptide (TPR) repeat protein